MAALIAAGAGARVVKHGNRAASSQCGSADVLEALGVAIELGPEGVAACVEAAGVGFCFAPRYHPAMRFLGPARRELGVPTTFNFLGPLANPAGVRRQAIGVSRPGDGDDDARRAAGSSAPSTCSCSTATTASTSSRPRRRAPCTSWSTATCATYTVDPMDFGIARADAPALTGGDAATNADVRHVGARAATRARAATSRCSTPPRRVVVAGHRAPTSARASRSAPTSLDSGARPARSTRSCASASTPRPRGRTALMAPVLQCPDCGTKHPIDVASDAAAFRCSGCGRTLKVPDAVPRRGRVALPVPSPAPGRTRARRRSTPSGSRPHPTVSARSRGGRCAPRPGWCRSRSGCSSGSSRCRSAS